MNACRHQHKCTNCGAIRACDKPECQNLFLYDVCTTRCEGAGFAPWHRHDYLSTSDGRRRAVMGGSL